MKQLQQTGLKAITASFSFVLQIPICVMLFVGAVPPMYKKEKLFCVVNVMMLRTYVLR